MKCFDIIIIGIEALEVIERSIGGDDALETAYSADGL